MVSSRLRPSTLKPAFAGGSGADVSGVRAFGAGSARARRRRADVRRGRPPVPDGAGRGEPLPPEATGALPRAAGEAPTRVGSAAPRPRPASAVLRLAGSPHGRPASDSPPLAPGGIPTLVALAVSARAPAPSGGPPAPDRRNGQGQPDLGRRAHRRGTPPETRNAGLAPHRPLLHGSRARRERARGERAAVGRLRPQPRPGCRRPAWR